MEKNLDYILEVARCGGISKAAKNLYITPSALSKFVQNKEAELGIRLFVREGKKFYLTYAGERYVAMLTEVLEKKTAMDQEMRRIADRYQGRLRLGFQMSLAEVVVTRILREFQTLYPHIRIVSEESGAEELMRMLRNQELDLILSLEEKKEDGFSYEKIADDPLVLVAPKGSGLGEHAVVRDGFRYPWLDAGAYRDRKLVMYGEGQMFGLYAERHFQSLGVKPSSDFLVRTTKTALLAVACGMGITITSELLVRQQHFEDRLDMFSYGNEQLTQELSVVCHRNTVFAEEIRGFYEIAKRQLHS